VLGEAKQSLDLQKQLRDHERARFDQDLADLAAKTARHEKVADEMEKYAEIPTYVTYVNAASSSYN